MNKKTLVNHVNRKILVLILGALMLAVPLWWHILDRSIPILDTSWRWIGAVSMRNLNFIDLIFYSKDNTFFHWHRLFSYLLIPAQPFFDSHFYFIRMLYVMSFSLLFVVYLLKSLQKLTTNSVMIICSLGIALTPWFIYNSTSVEEELIYLSCSLVGFYHLIICGNQLRKFNIYLSAFCWFLAVSARPVEGFVNLFGILFIFLYWKKSLNKVLLLWPLLPSIVFLVITVLVSKDITHWQMQYSLKFQLVALANMFLFFIYNALKWKNDYVSAFIVFCCGNVFWLPLRIDNIVFWLSRTLDTSLQTSNFSSTHVSNSLDYLLYFVKTGTGMPVFIIILLGASWIARRVFDGRSKITPTDKLWIMLLTCQLGLIFVGAILFPSAHYFALNILILMLCSSYFIPFIKIRNLRFTLLVAFLLLPFQGIGMINSLTSEYTEFLERPVFGFWNYMVASREPRLDKVGIYSHDLKKMLINSETKNKKHIGHFLQTPQHPRLELANIIAGLPFEKVTEFTFDGESIEDLQLSSKFNDLKLSHLIVTTHRLDSAEAIANRSYILRIKKLKNLKLVTTIHSSGQGLGPVAAQLYEFGQADSF